MDNEQQDAERRRLQALLNHTKATLARTTELLERQRATVEWHEQKGYPAQLARELFAEMSKVDETLRWQTAWIEHHLRQSAHLSLLPQPHPWAERQPTNLLALICFELKQIVVQRPSVSDSEATALAVTAAIGRAAGDAR